MPSALNFKWKLFLYYSSIFLIVTATFIAFQYKRERKFRIDQLENSLNSITDLTHNFLDKNNVIDRNELQLMDSLLAIVPMKEPRITVIDNKGKVIYDSFVQDYEDMENHLHRPEVQKAKFSVSGTGSNIRKSATTGQVFYYFAHDYGDYFVRAAVVYNVKVQNFLKAEKLFIFFIVFLFVVTWFILLFVTNKISESITKLKDFAIGLQLNKPLSEDYKFPQNELGVISEQIVTMYRKLTETKNTLSLERDKLIKHLYVLNEGVGFFSADKKAILTNTHFVQYLNLISEKSSIIPERIFEVKDLKELQKFIDKHVAKNKGTILPNSLPQIEFNLEKRGYYFEVKCIVFQDRSFEIYINDRSKLEKRKKLKQQMTSNIAHELKTPVASVSGYLETILHNKEIEPDKKLYFIEKAYNQSKRLNALIEDIVVLNRIEGEESSYPFSALRVREIAQEVIDNSEELIKQQKAEVFNGIDESVTIKGNETLVISVFQNLLDNALKYAGEKVRIEIEVYHEDEEYYYFSFKDNGMGIGEEHLHRVFERFYRIDSGRSRKMGGTGLGLAIVKHAVNLHKGEVSVKQGSKGGAEFFFNFPKWTE